MKKWVNRIFNWISGITRQRGINYTKIGATEERLTIVTDYMGTYVFHASDIVSIKPYGLAGIREAGLEIVHTVDIYEGPLRFLLKNREDRPLSMIKKAGFLSPENKTKKKSCPSIRVQQNPDFIGFVLKPQFLITLLSVLGILLYSVSVSPEAGSIIPFMIILPILLFGISTLLVWLLPPVRRFAIKEGRNTKEVIKFFRLDSILFFFLLEL